MFWVPALYWPIMEFHQSLWFLSHMTRNLHVLPWEYKDCFDYGERSRILWIRNGFYSKYYIFWRTSRKFAVKTEWYMYGSLLCAGVQESEYSGWVKIELIIFLIDFSEIIGYDWYVIKTWLLHTKRNHINSKIILVRSGNCPARYAPAARLSKKLSSKLKT